MKTALGVIIIVALNSCGSAKLAISDVKSAGTPVWKCKALSDPDFMTVSILEKNGTLLAKLYEESGDGDLVASDLVEVKAVSSGSLTSYVQLKGKLPVDSAIVTKPSRKTRGFVLQLDKSKADGITGNIDSSIKVLTGPTGSKKPAYDVRCQSRPLQG